jgi:hypothetical protein
MHAATFLHTSPSGADEPPPHGGRLSRSILNCASAHAVHSASKGIRPPGLGTPCSHLVIRSVTFRVRTRAAAMAKMTGQRTPGDSGADSKSRMRPADSESRMPAPVHRWSCCSSWSEVAMNRRAQVRALAAVYQMVYLECLYITGTREEKKLAPDTTFLW